MCCSGESDHPQYLDGRPEDQTFDEEELFFRRYRSDHFPNRQLLPSAFRFPHQSFNRAKYSVPEDVLHIDCCDGKKLAGGWGVLQCSLKDLRTVLSLPGSEVFEFVTVHKPRDCCYAHTELWCRSNGAFVKEPSPKVKETFRVQLALKMEVRIAAKI